MGRRHLLLVYCALQAPWEVHLAERHSARLALLQVIARQALLLSQGALLARSMCWLVNQLCWHVIFALADSTALSVFRFLVPRVHTTRFSIRQPSIFVEPVRLVIIVRWVRPPISIVRRVLTTR